MQGYFHNAKRRSPKPRAAQVLLLCVLLVPVNLPAQQQGEPQAFPTGPAEWVGQLRTARDVTGPGSWFKRMVKKIVGLDDHTPAMLQPQGVTVDPQGRILVADTKLRLVHVFDPQRMKYFRLEAPRSEPFAAPIAVAADGAGRIFVSDALRALIFVFDENGKFLRTIGRIDERESIFHRPTGLAVDSKRSRLYAVDTPAGRIFVLSPEGKVLARWGQRGSGPGEFNYPTHIAVARDGSLWVTDSLNFRVQHLDADGRFLSAFGRAGNGPAEFDKAKGITTDGHGRVYVVESRFDRVIVFDAAGRPRFVFGGTGSGQGQFFLPAGIAGGQDGHIYVVDSFNRRVQIFRVREDAASLPAGGPQ